MKHILFIAVAFIIPVFASAHTRWFASEELEPLQVLEPTSFYLSILATAVVVIVAAGIILHQRDIFRLSFLRPKAPHAFERAASACTMIAGAFLLIAGTHEYLLSPNLTPESGIPYALIMVQIAIGLAFMIGVGTRIFAIVLGLVWMSLFYYAGWVSAIENVWVLSLAMFIAIMGNDYFSLVSSSFLRDKLLPFKKYALSILRLGMGTTLVVLGFSEKILAPEFGINFLGQHSWNFMQLLGFNYSDYLFTLSAGSVEILFGLIFMLGIMTRLNALVAAVVFTIPLFILGPIELAGHLPHFAVMVLLLLFGGGGHLLFFRKYKDEETDVAQSV